MFLSSTMFLRSSALKILFQGAPFSSRRRPGFFSMTMFLCLGLHISREYNLPVSRSMRSKPQTAMSA